MPSVTTENLGASAIAGEIAAQIMAAVAMVRKNAFMIAFQKNEQISMAVAPAYSGFCYYGFACFGYFLDACHASSRAHVCEDAGNHERNEPQ